MSRVHPNDLDAVRTLINDIQALESRAHRLKMIETGHTLNAAKNKAGWELADQMSKKSFAEALTRDAAKLRETASPDTSPLQKNREGK